MSKNKNPNYKPNPFETVTKKDYNDLSFEDKTLLFKKEMPAKALMYQNKYGFDIESADGSPTHNNAADAFKHAFLSAILSYRYYETISTIFGNQHEMDNLKKFAPVEESNMDYWNNRQGREVTRELYASFKGSGKKPEDFSDRQVEDWIAERIMQKMINGELITDVNDKRQSPEIIAYLKKQDKIREKQEKELAKFTKMQEPEPNVPKMPDSENIFQLYAQKYNQEPESQIYTREDAQSFPMKYFLNNSAKIMSQNRNFGFPSEADAQAHVRAGNLEYVMPDAQNKLQYVTTGGEVYVEPYTRSDGTEVKGYYRAKPSR